ncbi:chromatin assembly factor-I (CAF-I) p90 subunit [Sporothrix curviconia]|uniref:Chromatin assembly factor-I (CAF-I) p90 subunit n=1 Tax=Sporothrix curviconia TaxID=1260050 RepID=A0ABP0BYU8_9PEZI
MPLLSVSPNIQDGGTDTPSRKRSLMDYLEMANKPATPSKLKLVTDAENLASLKKEKEQTSALPTNDKTAPGSPTDTASLDSPLSEISDGEMSLLTDDAGHSTPARSTSPNATPGKLSAHGSPRLVINLDATPPPGLLAALSAPITTTTKSPALAPGPPAKRKRLTPSEREEKAKADAARKLEKEKAEAAKKAEKEKAEAARRLEKEKKEKAEALKKKERDEQKAVADAKKKALAEEKEKKRKQKEEEDRKKNEEKEKKRKDKVDEERKVQEAKDKKERSQLRLNSFFKTGSSAAGGNSTSLPSSGSSLHAGSSPLKPISVRGNSASPQKSRKSGGLLSSQAGGAAGLASESETSAAPEISEYDRIFKPFFVKENVVMATDLYGMDDETKEAKSRILDEFLSGSRGDFAPTKPFSSASAVDYFHLPSGRAPARGRNRPTVRKIMNLLGPDALYGAGLCSSSTQDAQAKLALDMLKSVPMKYLFFREDVRPAYFGTVTSQPPQARLGKLARNPLAKTVLPLNYDYDSEAEWVDDDDGEDVDDLDNDEEELEDDGEMSDFLDDSEDALPLRPAFSGGMEPESTGVCWENERRQAPKPELDSFRMEFILDHDGPLDPFSTQYWETKEVAPAPDTTTASTSTPNKSMAPPPAPSDAFAALGAGAAAAAASTTASTTDGSSAAAATAPAASSTSTSTSTTASTPTTAGGKAVDPKKTVGVAAEFVPDLKKSILQYAKLSKLGIVEILSVEFTGKCTKSQIKNSLEALAERTGTGQNKTWKLKV